MLYKIYLGVNITFFTAAKLANLTTIMLITALSHPQKKRGIHWYTGFRVLIFIAILSRWYDETQGLL